MKDLQPLIEDVSMWVHENRDLVRQFGGLLIKLSAVSFALSPIVRTLGLVSTSIGAFRTALVGAKGLKGALQSIITMVTGRGAVAAAGGAAAQGGAAAAGSAASAAATGAAGGGGTTAAGAAGAGVLGAGAAAGALGAASFIALIAASPAEMEVRRKREEFWRAADPEAEARNRRRLEERNRTFRDKELAADLLSGRVRTGPRQPEADAFENRANVGGLPAAAPGDLAAFQQAMTQAVRDGMQDNTKSQDETAEAIRRLNRVTGGADTGRTPGGQF